MRDRRLTPVAEPIIFTHHLSLPSVFTAGLKRRREDSKQDALHRLDAREAVLGKLLEHEAVAIEGDYKGGLLLVKEKVASDLAEKVRHLEAQRDGTANRGDALLDNESTVTVVRSLRSKVAAKGDGEGDEDNELTAAEADSATHGDGSGGGGSSGLSSILAAMNKRVEPSTTATSSGGGGLLFSSLSSSSTAVSGAGRSLQQHNHNQRTLSPASLLLSKTLEDDEIKVRLPAASLSFTSVVVLDQQVKARNSSFGTNTDLCV